MDESTQPGEAEIAERVADLLLVFSNVAYGDFSLRLSIADDVDGDFAELYAGINDMLTALEGEHERAAEYRADLERRVETIEQQRAAIRELSTPILEVWRGVLCLPIVGVVDTIRSAEMTSQLLDAIARKNTRCAIIDLTGIEVMDTGTAAHFIRMARSARLLGAEVVLTGLNPHISQTVVHMGIDLSGLMTRRSLRHALLEYVGGADDDRAEQ